MVKEYPGSICRTCMPGGSGASKEAPGLAIVPKLKYEHLFRTSFSKMRVDLAAQVSYFIESCHVYCNRQPFYLCLHLGPE